MKRDYDKAEPLFLEAIGILEKAFNPNHVRQAVTALSHVDLDS
jgi:hypothetical protein